MYVGIGEGLKLEIYLQQNILNHMSGGVMERPIVLIELCRDAFS